MMQSPRGENRPLALAAFVLFVIGFILPVLCWAFWLPKVLLGVACGMEILALALGVKARRRRLGQIAIIGALMLGVLGTWWGRHGLPTYPLMITLTADWMKPADMHWKTQSAAKPWSIRTDAEKTWNGDDSLRFEMRAGDTWTDQTFQHTFRAEVTSEEFPPANILKWYTFGVFFPADFPIENNRLVFAQWKDRESLAEGLGRQGRSPPLAFRFVNGKFSIRLRHSAERVLRDPENIPEEELFKQGGFPLGQWHNFVVQAKWSWQDDGFVNVWWNGRQIVAYRGPAGYNQDFGPKFKFGLYRDATDKTYVAWFNHVKSGGTPQAVGFDPASAKELSENEQHLELPVQ